MRALNTIVFFLCLSLSFSAVAQQARLVKDITPGTASSFDFDFFPEDDGVKAAFADKIVFVVESGNLYSLWVSDGTEVNTTALLSDADDFTKFDNSDADNFYFTVKEGDDYNLYSLSKADLSLTSLFTSGSFIKAIAVQSDAVYLAVSNELIKVDPQTQMSETVYEFGNFRGIKDLHTFGENLIMIGGEDNGTELYFSDGTTAGTQPIFQLSEPTDSDFSRNYTMTEVGGQLFFFYNKPSEPFTLHRTDGTAEGTLALMGFESDPFYDMEARRSIIGWDNKLFFRARQLGNSQGVNEMFVSDGTVAGTNLLIVSEFNVSSSPTEFTVYNNELYFRGDEAGGIYTIYKTDGTQAGTERVIDRNALGSGLSFGGSFLTVYDDSLFFYAYRGEYGSELWASAGTTESTRVIDLNPGEDGASPSQITATENNLFFVISTSEHGKELFALDRNPMVATTEIVAGQLKVYPNPLQGEVVQIDLPSELQHQPTQVQIVDQLGRTVLQQALNDNRLNTSGLLPGVYVLSLRFDDKIYTAKLIKQ